MSKTQKNGSRNGGHHKRSARPNRTADKKPRVRKPRKQATAPATPDVADAGSSHENLPSNRAPVPVDVHLPAQRHDAQLSKTEKAKLNVGLANILAQAQVVTDAVGRPMGFVLMMTAVLASTGVTGTVLVIAAKSLGRLFLAMPPVKSHSTPTPCRFQE